MQVTKKTTKTCLVCGCTYYSVIRHKTGPSKTCETNIARARVRAITAKATAEGWERVGRWHQVIDAAEVPMLILESEVFDGCQVVDRLWAPAWAVMVAKQGRVQAYLRALAIRVLFNAPKERKLLEVKFRLSEDSMDRATITAIAKQHYGKRTAVRRTLSSSND